MHTFILRYEYVHKAKGKLKLKECVFLTFYLRNKRQSEKCSYQKCIAGWVFLKTDFNVLFYFSWIAFLKILPLVLYTDPLNSSHLDFSLSKQLASIVAASPL